MTWGVHACRPAQFDGFLLILSIYGGIIIPNCGRLRFLGARTAFVAFFWCVRTEQQRELNQD